MGKNKSKFLIFAMLSVAIILSMMFVSAYASPATVNLGTAGNYVILAKAGITNVPGSITSVTGDMGVSPIGYASITGFTLVPAVPDGTNTFSTSSLVTGKIYAADYTESTPTNLGVAILDMGTAYTDALSRASDEINPGSAGEIGGLTLSPGVYEFNGDSSDVLISTDIILNGGANDVWIFQIPGTFNVHANVILGPGVQAKNIFWVVAGEVTIFPGFTINGNILTAEPKTIAIQTGSTLNGRALSAGAVTLDADMVTMPGGVSSSLVLANITIATPANKLTYTVGDSLDIAGLTITKTYNDSSIQTITPLLSQITGFDSSSPMTGQVLTITYGTQTTNYTVDVVAVPPVVVLPRQEGTGGGNAPRTAGPTVGDVNTPTSVTNNPTTSTTTSSDAAPITGGVTGTGTGVKLGTVLLIILAGLVVAGIAVFLVRAFSGRKI